MVVAWTKDRLGWSGIDSDYPRIYMRVNAGARFMSWSVSSDERRLAAGEIPNGDGDLELAKTAAHAAMIRAGSGRRR